VQALSVEGVSKHFGAFVALRDVSLSVAQGEFVCLLGPSGCGKTTLLRIIAGLETQSAGRIVQNGRDISALPPGRRDYGIVFQSYALFPNLTVTDNVGYGLVNRRMSRTEIRARVTELLKLVGLPGSEPKYPSQLSGGQQQRIALARALATSPGLLLLDEPLSALDALERVRLRGEIRGLQKKVGVTTIMVTHDQEEALSMADRVVVMNKGHLEQVGTPREIYEQPASPFVADFVGRVNVLNGVSLGGGRYQSGRMALSANGSNCAPGTRVRLYLRPEDRVVEGSLDGEANRVSGQIAKVEFLGGHCLAELHIPELDGQALSVFFSLNQVRELGIREGAALELALRPDRIRVFES
jgi:iron(III) transport system ATP-binding protein